MAGRSFETVGRSRLGVEEWLLGCNNALVDKLDQSDSDRSISAQLCGGMDWIDKGGSYCLEGKSEDEMVVSESSERFGRFWTEERRGGNNFRKPDGEIFPNK